MPRKRKKLSAGSITSYKVPVIRGGEGEEFYAWLNKYSSFNGLITEALKIKFMLDTMKVRNAEKESTKGMEVVENNNVEDMESIDIFDERDSAYIDMQGLKKMMNSIAR